jgi:hypothetical protein
MLSDIEAACVAIALALWLINEKKNRRCVQEWYRRISQYTHVNLMTD